MTEIIALSAATIGGEQIQTVNARDLHAFLGVKTEFKDWIARRIKDFGFVENTDFCSFLSESSGGRPSKEFSVSLGMAKELCMVERNDKGKQARLYGSSSKTPVAKPDGTKMFCSAFLNDARMCCFFCQYNSKILT